MDFMMLGAIVMALMVTGLFFLRFWLRTRDRFFLFFAVSFWVEGVNRAVLGLAGGLHEEIPVIYLVRFLAFLLIIIAIVDKNRAGRSATR